jgi:hypothetical protein
MKKKLLITIVTLTLAVSAFAQQYTSETEFEYGWDKNVEHGIVITKYVGSQKEVRVPPTIEKLNVTSISGGAFRYNRNITSVTIPNGVTSIADGNLIGGAFQNCTSLASVTIPNSVKSIGSRAFSGCTSLTSVTIPNSITSIGDYAFSGCTSLAKVTIGSGVTYIGRDAFNGCTSLESITIPKSVTSIGVTVFKGCTNLISVTFQGTISDKYFGVSGEGKTSFEGSTVDQFPGDLPVKYLDLKNGGPGTYTRFANGKEWRKR